MRSGPVQLVAVGVGVLASVPDVATAQPLGPSAIVDAPPSVRAVVSFVLVLLFGGALLVRYEGFVDRSVDSSKERLLVSVVYGAIAYGLVGFACAYAYSQLVRLGIGTPVLSSVAVAVAGVVLLTLAGLGFVVVGTLLTELQGPRQPWTGLVVGASISAVAWFALPLAAGVVAWLAVTAVGIGGPTRKWVHAAQTRPVETDA
jgi:hypothetical protein